MQHNEHLWDGSSGYSPHVLTGSTVVGATLAALAVASLSVGWTIVSLREAPGALALPLSATFVLLSLVSCSLPLCTWLWLRRQEVRASARAFAKAQQIFMATLDGLRDAAIVADCNNRVVRMNAVSERLTGWTQAEAYKEPLDRIYHVELETSRTTESEASLERARPGVLLTRDGQSRRILYRKVACVDDHGCGLGEVALFYEATEPRENYTQEATGRLAGGLAHEFNNLLAVVLGYCDVLLARFGPDTDECRHILEVKTAGERAAELTRQLLAFSRRQVLEPCVLDLGALLTKMDRFARRIVGEDISVSIRCAPELWKVDLDPRQFDQIMIGLLANARDAMPCGGAVTIEVRNITSDTQPGLAGAAGVMLSVSDTGSGMSESTCKRVFTPFFTTKTPDTRTTGLELSMVQGIVEQSGGQIEVDSAVGKGTTFKIYFPRAKHEMTAASSDNTIAARTNGGGGERILLVEDEVAVRVLTRKLLERLGYHVIEATSAAAAIEICRSDPAEIQLLLTDVIMPHCSGGELVSRVLPLRPTIRVLYMSGYTGDIIGDHGVLEPGTLFLQKPFTSQTLAEKVREALATRLELAERGNPLPNRILGQLCDRAKV